MHLVRLNTFSKKEIAPKNIIENIINIPVQEKEKAQQTNSTEVNLDESYKEIYRQKRNSVIQSMMCKDIEDYIEKNMAEMHKALDELKASFEEELNNIDGKTMLMLLCREYLP